MSGWKSIEGCALKRTAWQNVVTVASLPSFCYEVRVKHLQQDDEVLSSRREKKLKSLTLHLLMR